MTINLFNLIDPPPTNTEMVQDILSNSTYPFWRIIPRLRQDKVEQVTVVWEDLGQQGIGLFYRHNWTIKMTTRYGRADDGGDPFTFAHELGHLVDAATLDRQDKQDLMDLMHETPGRYDDRIMNGKEHGWSHNQPHLERWVSNNDFLFRHNESFADLFVATFCPDIWDITRNQRFVHWTEDFDQVREIVLRKEIQVFNDVPNDGIHTEGINWAAEQGLLKGFPDGTFRPNEPVTRGQLATILKRALSK